jgi:flavin reductase (DIM6/NTAB) family NADH-FMN oxidoreductase RutF
VTTIVGDRPHGTTVSAFNSLSMTPPMVLVSLAESSDLLQDIRLSGRFGVNVLGHHNLAEAQAFATKGAAKFRSVDWVLDDGLPRLPAALGWLSCDVEETFVGGDHMVLLGLVRSVDSLDGPPLTYHGRQFGTHSISAAIPANSMATQPSDAR